MTPWSITEFQQWLKEEEKEIQQFMHESQTKEIIRMVFLILQKELQLKFLDEEEEETKCLK